jgi:hypothetical protein
MRRWRRIPISSSSSPTTKCSAREFAIGTSRGCRARFWASEISPEDSLDIYYDLFGYDKNVEPKLDELRRKGFSPDYVSRETKRSVASANGKEKIYTGVGFNEPGSPPDDAETVYEATRKSFQAGAAGIVISREYEEMRVPNLQAVGRAVREVTGV